MVFKLEIIYYSVEIKSNEVKGIVTVLSHVALDDCWNVAVM
jgi:hypothetical protein